VFTDRTVVSRVLCLLSLASLAGCFGKPVKIKGGDAAVVGQPGDGSGTGGETGSSDGPGSVADSKIATDGPTSNGGSGVDSGTGGSSGTVDSSVAGSGGSATAGSSVANSGGGGRAGGVTASDASANGGSNAGDRNTGGSNAGGSNAGGSNAGGSSGAGSGGGAGGVTASDASANGGSNAGGSSGAGSGGSSSGGVAGSSGTGLDAAPDVSPDVTPVDAPGTCGADKDCTSQAPLCLANRCARCAGDNDCAGRAGPACATNGSCVACTSSKQCTGTAKTCDTTTNQCVGCVIRSDCAGACQTCAGGVCAAVCGGATPKCVSDSCVQCATNADCGGAAPKCVSGNCVQCATTADCATGVCTNNTCACTASDPCPGKCGSIADTCGIVHSCSCSATGQFCYSGACSCRQSSPGNLITNGGFETSLGLAGWEADPNSAEAPYHFVSWDTEDSDGCVGSGSIKDSQPSPAVLDEPRRCVVVGENQNVSFGARFKTDPGTASYCDAFEMDDVNCFVDLALPGHRIGGSTSTSWANSSTSFTTAPGTRALYILCYLQGKMDQVYMNLNVNSY